MPQAFPRNIAFFVCLALLASVPELAAFGVNINTVNGIVVLLVVSFEAAGEFIFFFFSRLPGCI